MTAVECHDELGEDAPDKRFLGILVLEGEVADDSAEVTVSAVLHVEVQVL